MSETFQFPKTRKSRAARKFIEAYESARRPFDLQDRKRQEAEVLKAELTAIQHSPDRHTIRELAEASVLLDAVGVVLNRLFNAASSTTIDLEKVDCDEVFELADAEARAAAQAEIDAIEKTLPKGVSIDLSTLESSAVEAVRMLDATTWQSRTSTLYEALTA